MVKCDLCAHVWVAVYPCDLTKLECPNCENQAHFEILSNNSEKNGDSDGGAEEE